MEASEAETPGELDITTRDGAIAILREMRRSTIEIITADPEAKEDIEIQLAEIFAQLYGITVILSGILGDPNARAEMLADDERVTEVLQRAIDKVKDR